MLTVDANVWVAARFSTEPGHAQCAALLRAAADRGERLVCPVLVLPETACTAARKCRDQDAGRAVLAHLLILPGLVLAPLDEALARDAAALGARHFLRAADAVYAAVAQRAGATLVTLDQELRERVAPALPCLTPAEWLATLPGGP
jgi:predicted nucleic acid-binding protein